MGLAIFKRLQRLQGGTEAVPEELPTPPLPPEAYQSPAVRSLLDQVRQGILPDDALAEIQNDPTSLRSMLAYGQAALAAGTLLSGGEGEKLPIGEKLPTVGGETIQQPVTPKIEIKKFQPSDQAWGSPGNNYKTSAKYDVVIDGKLRGKLWAAGVQRYMEKPVWEITSINPDGTGIRPLKTIWTGGKKAAVEWINDNHHKFPIQNEATQTEPDALPTVPTGETGPGTTEEPPQDYVRGTSVVRGYGPTHMLNTL